MLVGLLTVGSVSEGSSQCIEVAFFMWIGVCFLDKSSVVFSCFVGAGCGLFFFYSSVGSFGCCFFGVVKCFDHSHVRH